MSRKRLVGLRAVAIVLLIGAVLGVPRLVQAGCLIEYHQCAECAQALLWDAMKSASPSKVSYANLYLADCAIDFYHCFLLGKRHDYACPVAL